MPNCAAFGCTNRSSNNKSLLFHQIPGEGRNKELRKRWLSNIRRAGDLPKDKSFYVCSGHFEVDCYERDLKKELMENKPGAKRLKMDAVPTVFTFTKPIEKRKASIERALRKEKRILLDIVDDSIATASTSTEDPMLPMNNSTEEPMPIDEPLVNSKLMVTVGTQCTIPCECIIPVEPAPVKTFSDVAVNTDNVLFQKTMISSDSDSDESSGSTEMGNGADTSFRIEDADETTDDDNADYETEEPSVPHEDSKFIIFWSCLLTLLRFCSLCGSPAVVRKVTSKGLMLQVDRVCSNDHETKWYSTPSIRGMSTGNLVVAASILYSGNTYTRICELMSICNIKFFGRSCYHAIQRKILFPVVDTFYNRFRKELISKIKGPIHVSGDGRCDSPGYNAKYGTYTIMDSSNDNILDFSVIHVGSVANSSHMEKEGMIACLGSLECEGIKIKSLTTDRHKQIRAYLRKERGDVKHQFDIWHVGKNIKKKLVKMAKKKGCRELNEWIKSIINHFWWCCATCNKDPVLLQEKWVSILFHIRNMHRWEDAGIYKKCEHEKLSKRDKREKLWLEEGCTAYIALETVVKEKTLLNDLQHLTDFNHTGQLEVYHSLYNKYCPKRLHFGWNGMVARSQLAILDHNSGTDLAQAKTAENKDRYKLAFSKVTQNWVTKKISEKKDKGYLQELMDETLKTKQENRSVEAPKLPASIPKNIAPTQKPDKDEALKNIRTRFET